MAVGFSFGNEAQNQTERALFINGAYRFPAAYPRNGFNVPVLLRNAAGAAPPTLGVAHLAEIGYGHRHKRGKQCAGPA